MSDFAEARLSCADIAKSIDLLVMQLGGATDRRARRALSGAAMPKLLRQMRDTMAMAAEALERAEEIEAELQRLKRNQKAATPAAEDWTL